MKKYELKNVKIISRGSLEDILYNVFYSNLDPETGSIVYKGDESDYPVDYNKVSEKVKFLCISDKGILLENTYKNKEEMMDEVGEMNTHGFKYVYTYEYMIDSKEYHHDFDEGIEEVIEEEVEDDEYLVEEPKAYGSTFRFIQVFISTELRDFMIELIRLKEGKLVPENIYDSLVTGRNSDPESVRNTKKVLKHTISLIGFKPLLMQDGLFTYFFNSDSNLSKKDASKWCNFISALAHYRKRWCNYRFKGVNHKDCGFEISMDHWGDEIGIDATGFGIPSLITQDYIKPWHHWNTWKELINTVIKTDRMTEVITKKYHKKRNK